MVHRRFKSRSEVKQWIIENQFGRRNITLYQRSLLALQLESLFRVKSRDRQSTAGKNKLQQNSAEATETRKELARVAGVSHDTITRVKAIEKKATKAQKAKLVSGEVSINEVYKLIHAEGIVAQRDRLRKELEGMAVPPLPKRKYRCIVIDPPWHVKKVALKSRPNEGKKLDYPTMSLDEISGLPIAKLADQKGCHVYLWVIHRYLPDGLKLFESWGVKYQCVLTWVKRGGMTPFRWNYNTEHVLFGTVGKLELFKLGVKLSFEGKRLRHSQKPDEFYTIVKQVSPSPRLDMFSRERREGFDAWGKEI